MSGRPAALVFGAHITALAVIRAFGRSRVPVYVAGGDRTAIARSRWYRPVEGTDIGETTDGARLGEYLRALPLSRSVLFPCSDRWALALASLPADIARRHVPVVAALDVVRTLVDKRRFARAATALDVPAPRVVEPDALSTIDARDIRRFFVKPSNSQHFADRFGVKAIPLESRDHASDLLGRLAADNVDVILQELVPGPPAAHVFLDGYVDRAGTMRACLARRRLRMYPRPFGNSTLSVTIPVEPVAQAVDALRRLFDGLGYTGLFDAEFAYDERDGLYKIVEVNARPWWQLELTQGSGLDVCGMAYRDAIGEPIATATSYQIGRTWVHPVPDLTAWWTARRAGERSGRFPLAAWLMGSNAVFRWDDPMPAFDEVVRLVRLARAHRQRRKSRLEPSRTPS